MTDLYLHFLADVCLVHTNLGHASAEVRQSVRTQAHVATTNTLSFLLATKQSRKLGHGPDILHVHPHHNSTGQDLF